MSKLASTFRTAVLVRREVLAYTGEPNRAWRKLYGRYIAARNAYAAAAVIDPYLAHQHIDQVA